MANKPCRFPASSCATFCPNCDGRPVRVAAGAQGVDESGLATGFESRPSTPTNLTGRDAGRFADRVEAAFVSYFGGVGRAEAEPEDVLAIVGHAGLALIEAADQPGHCERHHTHWYPIELPCPECE